MGDFESNRTDDGPESGGIDAERKLRVSVRGLS